MKKILTTIAALVVASTLFAVDFSASVSVDASIGWGTVDNKKGTYDILGVSNTNQRYSKEFLKTSFSGDRAGAQFQFYSLLKPDTGDAVGITSLAIWLQPIDALKITVGNVGDNKLYLERITWYNMPNMAAYASAEFDPNTTPEGTGVQLDINTGKLSTVLVFNGSPFISSTGMAASYGIMSKMAFTGNFSAGFGWRDDGGANKYFVTGFDVGSWGTPYYGFMTGRFKFKADMSLDAFMIDNYIKYNFGFMTAELTAPIIFRIWSDDGEYSKDPSYMRLDAKVTIPINALSLSISVGSRAGADGMASIANRNFWVFGSTFAENFSLFVGPGVAFNVGSCAVSVGAEFRMANYKDGDDIKTKLAWNVPLGFRVQF